MNKTMKKVIAGTIEIAGVDAVAFTSGYGVGAILQKTKIGKVGRDIISVAGGLITAAILWPMIDKACENLVTGSFEAMGLIEPEEEKED